MPVEIDLSRVRRDAEVGIRGLGQTLDYRDRPIEFPVPRNAWAKPTISTVSDRLIKPTRGSRSDIALPRGSKTGDGVSFPVSPAAAGTVVIGADATGLLHAHL